MNIIEMITFLIIFIGIIYFSSKNMAKDEKKREKQEFTNREALETENSEYDYGHNVKHNSEEI